MAMTRWRRAVWVIAIVLAGAKLIHVLTRTSESPPSPPPRPVASAAPDAADTPPSQRLSRIYVPIPDGATIDVQLVVADLGMLDEPHRRMMLTRLWLLSGARVGRSFLEPELEAIAEAAPSARFWIGLVASERRPVLLSYVDGAVDEVDADMKHDPDTLVARKAVNDVREAAEISKLFSLLPVDPTTTLKTFGPLRSEWQHGPEGPVLVRIPPPTATMLAEHAPAALPREQSFYLGGAAVAALTEAATADDTVLSKVFARSWREATPQLGAIHSRERLPKLQDRAGDVPSRTVLYVPVDIAAELERRAAEIDTSMSTLVEAAIALAPPSKRVPK